MELYHLINRGVDKRAITLDDQDRKRFVTDLFVMNDRRSVENLNFILKNTTDLKDIIDIGRRYEALVQIHAWCLMGNHYHLLVSEVAESGISRFLKKLNMGYAKYFNERYKRTGALFQGKTKKVLIENDAHFLWILHYIHFNPLDFLKEAGGWRTQCLAEPGKASKWLKNYQWSSYRDYANEGAYPTILEGSFLYEDRDAHMKEAMRILESFAEAPISFERFE